MQLIGTFLSLSGLTTSPVFSDIKRAYFMNVECLVTSVICLERRCWWEWIWWGSAHWGLCHSNLRHFWQLCDTPTFLLSRSCMACMPFTFVFMMFCDDYCVVVSAAFIAGAWIYDLQRKPGGASSHPAHNLQMEIVWNWDKFDSGSFSCPARFIPLPPQVTDWLTDCHFI